MALSAITGSYEVSGNPIYDPGEANYTYSVAGSLPVELVGGPAVNYIDVDCDGTVTGQGSDRISGIITKNPQFNGSGCPDRRGFGGGTGIMNWDITIDRSFTITGNVTGAGEVELDLQIDTAQFSFNDGTTFSEYVDCEMTDWTGELSGIDLSGDVERLRLSDAEFDPAQPSAWNPEVTSLDTKTWLEEVGERFRLVAYYTYEDGEKVGMFSEPGLLAPEDELPYMHFNSVFFYEEVTADLETDVESNSKTPAITEISLDEPEAFLSDVAVDTSVTVSVDWRESDGPQQVEFTYGSTTETVASGGEQTTWTFDAGDTATSITAKAISASGDSAPWEVATPKVTVPGWAGSASDWSGSGGVQYEATLDWPISLETTQTISSLSLVTGLWGVSGSISSEFNAKASSSGTATTGDLSTQASLNLAANTFNFDMEGDSSTTLSCDDLTTNGTADASFPQLRWEKTLNPVTAIPGLSSAVCGLSGLLCDLVNSIGPEAEVTVNLSGSGDFTGEGGEITWENGSLTGSIDASISVSAIPKVARSIVNIGIEGGGSGCIEFQFSPNFQIQQLGGEIHVAAFASFLGLSVNPSHDWPFGDTCGGRSGSSEGTLRYLGDDGSRGGTGWVPADGQLAMAVSGVWSAAVWSSLPAGQARPSGDINVQLWDGSDWGTVMSLQSDNESDRAPVAQFDGEGQLLVVYQRSTSPIPTMAAELSAFANSLELHFAVVSPATQTVLASGQLTNNLNNDFGATLVRADDGAVHLFWQRAEGTEIFGTSSNPTSIYHAEWDPLAQAFQAESVAALDLENTFGWTAAVATPESGRVPVEGGGTTEMLIALVIDTNADLTDRNDREVFSVSRLNGIWQAPAQVTNNGVPDEAAVAAFDVEGALMLWNRDGEVYQVRDDLGSAAELAFVGPNSLYSDGIGAAFGDSVVLGDGDTIEVIWPQSTQLHSARDAGDEPLLGWSTPVAFEGGPGAQAILTGGVFNGDLIVGYSTRLFAADGRTLEPTLTPIVVRRAFQPEIFSDGFETGDSSGWSSSQP